MSDYHAVAEALRLAEKQTTLLREVVKDKAERQSGSSNSPPPKERPTKKGSAG